MKQSQIAAVGLTYRFAPLDYSAELIFVDLETEKVVGRCWLPRPKYDLTPGDRPTGGGRQRGARGVVVQRGSIYVATFDAIHCFDASLRHIESITNERLCDIHEFQVTDQWFIVTSTRMDAVVWCDRSSSVKRVWCATEDPVLTASDLNIAFLPRSTDSDWRALYPKDNPTHLNAVSIYGADVLVALHNQGVLWNIGAGAIHHDARGMNASKTHNHQQMDDGSIVLNDTRNGKFYRITGEASVCIDVSEPGIATDRPAGLSAEWAVHHGWLRGFATLDSRRVLVGQCPASLVILDVETQSIERVIRLSSDWKNARRCEEGMAHRRSPFCVADARVVLFYNLSPRRFDGLESDGSVHSMPSTAAMKSGEITPAGAWAAAVCRKSTHFRKSQA